MGQGQGTKTSFTSRRACFYKAYKSPPPKSAVMLSCPPRLSDELLQKSLQAEDFPYQILVLLPSAIYCLGSR